MIRVLVTYRRPPDAQVEGGGRDGAGRARREWKRQAGRWCWRAGGLVGRSENRRGRGEDDRRWAGVDGVLGEASRHWLQRAVGHEEARRVRSGQSRRGEHRGSAHQRVRHDEDGVGRQGQARLRGRRVAWTRARWRRAFGRGRGRWRRVLHHVPRAAVVRLVCSIRLQRTEPAMLKY